MVEFFHIDDFGTDLVNKVVFVKDAVLGVVDRLALDLFDDFGGFGIEVFDIAGLFVEDVSQFVQVAADGHGEVLDRGRVVDSLGVFHPFFGHFRHGIDVFI